MKMYEEVEGEFHFFLTWILGELSSQVHTLTSLPLGKSAPCTKWIQEWVDPRASLDTSPNRKISCPCQPSPPVQIMLTQVSYIAEFK